MDYGSIQLQYVIMFILTFYRIIAGQEKGGFPCKHRIISE